MALMRFPRHFIERLRSQLVLSEVVGRHVTLRRHGREHQALCPFHKEKTPSFTVSDEKGFYHCFGCGAHGDAIKFIMETQGMSYPEAVESLAADAGIPVPQMTEEEVKKERRMLSLYEVMEQACLWFEQQLHAPAGREVMEYLQQRGIKAETIRRFRIGFAPQGKNAISQALSPQGISDKQLQSAGLVILRDDGSSYDRFRGRVIFPISDARERVVAFGGRTLSADKSIAKYLNSPETELFHKGELLYNFAAARRAAYKAGEVIVGEGYMDVIAMAQAGIDHAVAPLGTAVTSPQLRLLWRLADAPVFCLDGDDAGKRAMEKAADLAMPLLEPGKTMRFALLPSGEDPDSLLRYHGRQAFDGVVEASVNLSQMLWQTRLAKIGSSTPEKKAALESELMALVARINNATVQAHFKSFFKERLWSRRDKLRKTENNKNLSNSSSDSLLQGLTPPRSGNSILNQFEQQLILLVINTPELLQGTEIEENFSRMQCHDERIGKVHAAILEWWHPISDEEDSASDVEELCVFLSKSSVDGVLRKLRNGLNNNVLGNKLTGLSVPGAIESWQSLWDGYILAQMQDEYRKAEADLAVEVNEKNLERLTELQRQMEELRRSRTFSTSSAASD